MRDRRCAFVAIAPFECPVQTVQTHVKLIHTRPSFSRERDVGRFTPVSEGNRHDEKRRENFRRRPKSVGTDDRVADELVRHLRGLDAERRGPVARRDDRVQRSFGASQSVLR